MQKRMIAVVMAMMLAITMVKAQMQPTELDKSPMDISYSPNAFPIMKFQGKATGTPNARVMYSRPQKRGRTIFGGEVKYDEAWRLGANENTEIELFKDGTIGGKKIAKGRYSMFCIPTADSWTIIINKDLDNWGNFNYDSKKDLLRFSVPVQKTDLVENFTIYFDISNNLLIMWDDVKVSIPMSFLPEKLVPPAKPKGK
ncbi:MAG: DUF2911 domain-containing protein [Bacteroidota bacterium]